MLTPVKLSRFNKQLLSTLMLGLWALPASAANTRSFTQEHSGISYILTSLDPLPVGEQKLSLKLMRDDQLLKGAKLSAVATMGDGMKIPVKITSKASGELELTARFSMGGKWQLKLQQSVPVKAEIKFDLMVAGGGHLHH